MSTETTRRGARARRNRGFALAFAVVIAVLVVVVASGAALSLAQGPRLTAVEVDPDAAVTTSGARMILTTNQSLNAVTADQVSVEPAAEVSVDTSGRTIGIRFALPLQTDTEYTVTIEGVEGLGTGPSSTLTETFQTPPDVLYLLQRGGAPDGSGDDVVFRTGITGEDAVPVFTASHIEDFRETANYLVFSLRTDDDLPRLVVTDLDGQNAQDLTLPGDGTITQLQSADRSDLVGYVYSDKELSDDSGQVSALYTASLRDPTAQPTPVDISGADARILQWRFVPDTDSTLVLTFTGRLLLASADGSDAVDLGDAVAINGIARGASTATIERLDALYSVDLTDGTVSAVSDADGFADEVPVDVTPLPGTAGSLRTYALLAADGFPEGLTVQEVATEGAAAEVFAVAAGDSMLQTCVSPSGRYAAFMIAPDAVDNPYDTYLLPLPGEIETHIVDLETDEEVVALAGTAISWCRVPIEQ